MDRNINEIKENQIYRHFKGNRYQVLCIAKHTETYEDLVVYKALSGDGQVYARPLPMFLSKVDREKFPDEKQEYRFELEEIGIQEDIQETTEKAVEETTVKSIEETTEENAEVEIEPLVLEFLDADNYLDRLNILAALHHRITDDMLTTMAISMDIEVGEGDLEERYEQLKRCLLTLEKYECNRIR